MTKTIPGATAPAADVVPAPDDDAQISNPVVDAADTSGGDGAGAQPEPARAPAPVADEDRDDIVKRFRAKRDAGKTAAPAAADGDRDPDDNDDADQGEGSEGDAPAVSKAAEGAQAAGEGGKVAAVEPVQDAEITLIVDGKPVKKSLAEITKLAQITVAGDNRLDETKRLLKEAQDLRAKSGTPTDDDTEGHKPNPSPARGSKPENPPAPTIDRAKLQQFAERIQVGDAEDGAAALEELVTLVNSNRPQTESLTADQVGKLFQQHFVQRETQQDIDKAVADFTTKFETIAKDPDYRDVALTKLRMELRKDLTTAGLSDEDLAPFGNDVTALAHAHRHAISSGHKSLRSYGAILDSIGTEVSTKFGIKPKAAPQPGSQQQQQQRVSAPSSAAQRRQEDKRNTPQQPRTAGVRAPSQSQAPRPKTTREKVNEMRQARGFDAA